MGDTSGGDRVAEGMGFRGSGDGSGTRTFPEVPARQIRDLEGDFSPGSIHTGTKVRPEAPVPVRDADLRVKACHVFIQCFPFCRDRLPRVRTSPLKSEKAMHANKTSQPVMEVTIKWEHAIDRNLHIEVALGKHRRKHQIQIGVDSN